MSRHIAIAISASLALANAATAALAHAQLQKAAPAIGSTLATSPKEIRLKFSEGVEPRFSGIALATEAGASAPLGKAGLDPADNSVLTAPVLQALKPGVYTVTWHAVSVDTHKTQGSFNFTLAP
jgi:methionine-rich copper-binding protein CopC